MKWFSLFFRACTSKSDTTHCNHNYRGLLHMIEKRSDVIFTGIFSRQLKKTMKTWKKYVIDKRQQGLVSQRGNKCAVESVWMSRGWQQSYTELPDVAVIKSIQVLNSQEPNLHPATNKTLNKMPHHSTNTTVMLNVTTFWNKTNKRLTPEDWYEKNASLCIQMENWHGGIPRNKSRSAMNMNNNICSQWELFQCHKYVTLWLNVTHLWALFHPSFCCLVHCSKTALMPFSLLYRHFLCAILAPCFVVFSSSPYRRDF